MTPLFFLLAAFGFGFVIFIHELGHFLFAKWAGVRVEVFSIGFGPRLLTKRIGETEYSLSLLPLGGYVRMTGQEDLPEDATNPATAATVRDTRSFLNATPLWKAAILLGGVLFNFLSSYAILLGLAIYGLPVLRPIVGEVHTEIIGSDGQSRPSPAAEMGLRPGDRVLTINGEVVRSFEDLSTGAIIAGRKPITLTVARPGIDEPLSLPLEGTVTAAYDANVGRPVLGLQLPFSNRLGQLPEWYPAATGEAPKAGERVVAIDGVELTEDVTGQEIHERLQAHFAKPVRIALSSADGRQRTTTITYSGLGDGVEASLGLPPVINGVSKGSAAEQAGLRAGDVITRIDGVAPSGSDHFLALVRTAMQQSGSCTVTVRRLDGSTLTAPLTGREQAGRRRLGIMVGTLSHGVVPVLAPTPSGSPAAAAIAGINPGDALVRWEADAEDRTRFHAAVTRGGNQLEIPLSAEGAQLAAVSKTPGVLGRLFGSQAQAAIAEQLRGTRIVSNVDPIGNPTGSPAPGLLLVTTPGGSPRTIDLRPLKADGEALLQQAQSGDWILGVATGANGKPCWQLLRGTETTVRQVTLNGTRLGRPLPFEVEVVPYKLGSIGEAFAIANRAAHTMIWKSLLFIPKFFQTGDNGGLDAQKSLQGPIGIFDALRVNAESYGFTSFLNLVALIGLNLVLVNLLPIPITDGGQLVFLAIETAIGRPLPPLVRTIAAYIGLALVVSLMLFVTTLDIARRL